MMRPSTPYQNRNARRSLIAKGPIIADELVARAELPPRGDIDGPKLVITYAGAFDFQVGRSLTWIDPSHLLFANAGESYVDHHVLPDTGHSSVILTPDENALDELCGAAGWRSAPRARACSLQVQLLVQFLRRATGQLEAQELGVAILEESRIGRERAIASDPRQVRRAKAALHDCVDGRSSLTQIASDLGVSPVYLTQMFKRSEGIPLYRYQTFLRLGRALDRLPEQDDITDLALELGFSSHSHFTAAFRSRFGVTPSQYRSEANGHTRPARH